MSKEELAALKSLAWVVVCAVCWLYASKGYSAYPQFEVWFWGIAFWIDLVALGLNVSVLVAES